MNSKPSWFNVIWHMVGIWKMEDRHFCHQQHTFKWISNRHLLNIFSVFLVSVCLKKKLHTSFPPNQKRLCEIHKDGRERKNFTDSKKVFFFFSLCIKRAVKKDKKWEARKEKGGKPVSLTKKFKVRKQRLLTSPNLSLCPHLSFWTTAQYWKLLPTTVNSMYLTRQGAEHLYPVPAPKWMCKLKKTWFNMFYQYKCI